MTDLREVIARALGNCDTADDAVTADRILAAIEAAGWQCVPKEPTLDQIGAARDQADCLGDIYRAMLAAAPDPRGEK